MVRSFSYAAHSGLNHFLAEGAANETETAPDAIGCVGEVVANLGFFRVSEGIPRRYRREF